MSNAPRDLMWVQLPVLQPFWPVSESLLAIFSH
jgi:hypothetical protein